MFSGFSWSEKRQAGHLRKKSKKRQVAMVASGPAFEGWLNAEIGVVLNSANGALDFDKGEYLWGEKTKRDLVICRADHSAGWVIEVKLVYPWPRSKMRAPVLRLREQVDPKWSDRYADEDERTQRAGIIFGVFLEPPPKNGAWAAGITRTRFFSELKETVHEVFPHGFKDRFAIQHQDFYYPVKQVTPAGWDETATVGMMYVTRRR
jgi:hypothetical protein